MQGVEKVERRGDVWVSPFCWFGRLWGGVSGSADAAPGSLQAFHALFFSPPLCSLPPSLPHPPQPPSTPVRPLPTTHLLHQKLQLQSNICQTKNTSTTNVSLTNSTRLTAKKWCNWCTIKLGNPCCIYAHIHIWVIPSQQLLYYSCSNIMSQPILLVG